MNRKQFLAGCYWLLGSACVWTFAGCAFVQEKVPFIGERYRTRNEGFSLLYQLASKQKDVDKILIVKHASSKTSNEINAIAGVFRHASEQFDAFVKADSSLRVQEDHLPALEKKTRGSIESTTTKRLLFSTGKEFELQLLLTQFQALDYAYHLARELGKQDTNQKRQAFLNAFAQQCEQHLQEVTKLLSSL